MPRVWEQLILNVWGTQPLLVALSVASLSIRLRGPRPSLRHCARQPGFLASLVVTTVLAVYTIQALSNMASAWVRNPREWRIFVSPDPLGHFFRGIDPSESA